MGEKRRKSQMELAFQAENRGETPTAAAGRVEADMAKRANESPAVMERRMEEVCAKENVKKALKQVLRNKGAPGVDGMTVYALPKYLAEHWPGLREQLLNGAYKPQPVRRVNIPKPDGGMRPLGIPTVLDRFIQQAVMQVMRERWDGTFSDHSYGFRSGRSAHQAVAKAQEYIAQGHAWVVDIDIEKFFDKVNHDRLMAMVARKEEDKRLLKLLRAFLNAGVMEGGLVSPTAEGTPQGGPLSPLLSNIVLDELDAELQRRGHLFVRYADDCNIYVHGERAGQRVMESVRRFIERKLKLRINETKSAVAQPDSRKFLGFSFTPDTPPKRRIAPQAVRRFRGKIRKMTRRAKGRSLAQLMEELAKYLTGWRGYFAFCETPSALKGLDAWLRRRLRSYLWNQWENRRNRYRELRKRGIGRNLAAQTAASSLGPWRISHCRALCIALPNTSFDRLGLPRLAPKG